MSSTLDEPLFRGPFLRQYSMHFVSISSTKALGYFDDLGDLCYSLALVDLRQLFPDSSVGRATDC